MTAGRPYPKVSHVSPAGQDFPSKLAKWISKNRWGIIAGFVLAVISLLISIYGTFLTHVDVSKQVSDVVDPATLQIEKKIDTTKTDILDGIKRTISEAAPPVAPGAQPASGAQPGLSSHVGKAPSVGDATSPEAEACGSTSPDAQIPLYVETAVMGVSETTSDDIRKSIQSRLPAGFYITNEPKCAALYINARIDVAIQAKSIRGLEAQNARASAQFEYKNGKTSKTQTVNSSYGEDFVDQDYLDNPKWPEKYVVAMAVCKNLADISLRRFLDLSPNINVSESGEKSASQCAAD